MGSPLMPAWALALSLERWEIDVSPHRLGETDNLYFSFSGHKCCKHEFVIARWVIAAILCPLPDRFKAKSHKRVADACLHSWNPYSH